MYNYKVEYIDVTHIKGTWKDTFRGEVDGRMTSKNLEALLLEKDKEGYELFSIVPLAGNNKMGSGIHMVMTSGFIVTFRKKEEE